MTCTDVHLAHPTASHALVLFALNAFLFISLILWEFALPVQLDVCDVHPRVNAMSVNQIDTSVPACARFAYQNAAPALTERPVRHALLSIRKTVSTVARE